MTKDSEGPPEAPSIDRRLRFGRLQLAGLIVIALIPAAAMAGVFGESQASAEASTAAFTVRMRYPERLRYRQTGRFDIFLENRSNTTLDTITVQFDTAYVTRFADPVFVPDPTEPFRIPISNVRSGETRLVTAWLKADATWAHEGDVRITSGNNSVSIRVRTLVFP